MAEIEYIERKKVISHLDSIANDQQVDKDYKTAAWTFSVFVDRLPAADVRPVIHGKWVTNFDDFTPANHCSICKVNFPDIAGSAESVYSPNLMHYCPNCGARMDGDENDP